MIVNGEPRCRKCLQYNGKVAQITTRINPRFAKAKINYALSPEQNEISLKLLNGGTKIYVNAVCGAGKTEITFQSIEKALANGYRVGFIIPRRDVVKEIATRLKKVYPQVIVSEVYGGHTQILDGEIVVLTTHQAYRYPNKFGLIIVDEYDAFPFKGDEVLHHFVEQSCFGQKIYLSATWNKVELIGKENYALNKRYHNHPLPVPVYLKCHHKLLLLKTLLETRKLLKKPTCVFIFLPSISETIRYYSFLKCFFRDIMLYNSQCPNKEMIFKNIKQAKYRVVVCTTILERGITIKNLDIIVAEADAPIFSHETLIQIAGRVGRIASRNSGQVLFLAQHKTHEITTCINTIETTNLKVSFMP